MDSACIPKSSLMAFELLAIVLEPQATIKLNFESDFKISFNVFGVIQEEDEILPYLPVTVYREWTLHFSFKYFVLGLVPIIWTIIAATCFCVRDRRLYKQLQQELNRIDENGN
mmetsp:Transcript_5442/g.4978  ORF Transcript_5442/g.4978 Transcript_5442/m.4978 type:complete len:113 (+) Transcript_5442:351-689(+)